MPTIHYENDDGFHSIELKADETVLNGLLRSDIKVPNACRSGVCQTCIMQATDPVALPSASQKGLKPSQAECGKFLACCCIPEQSITIRKSTSQKHTARVISKHMLGDSVIRLRLTKPFDYTAGQYVTIENPNNNEGRCYSLTSHPILDDYIEFHIRFYHNGEVSSWINQSVEKDDLINLYSPVGDCVYQSTDLDQTLYFAAIGTGAGTLCGVIKDARHRGHRGKINYLIGGINSDSFYLENELKDLKDLNVEVHQVALETKPGNHSYLFKANVYEYAQQFFPNIKDAKVYLCGASSFVSKMRKQSFLAGASMKNIHSDSFTPPS